MASSPEAQAAPPVELGVGLVALRAVRCRQPVQSRFSCASRVVMRGEAGHNLLAIVWLVLGDPSAAETVYMVFLISIEGMVSPLGGSYSS